MTRNEHSYSCFEVLSTYVLQTRGGIRAYYIVLTVPRCYKRGDKLPNLMSTLGAPGARSFFFGPAALSSARYLCAITRDIIYVARIYINADARRGTVFAYSYAFLRAGRRGVHA